MGTKKRIAVALLMAFVVVAVLAGIHYATRTKVPERCIILKNGEQEICVDVDALETSLIDGQVKNGKGELKEIEGQGILLSAVISAYMECDFSEVRVVSDDEYAAKLEASEVMLEEKAYLLMEQDQVRLYVFGDANSKRNVSNVVQIVME